MNLAREHFFAHAGLAFDEERQVRSSHPPPGRLHVSPHPAFGEARCGFGRGMVLDSRRDNGLPAFQRILNRQDQVLVVNVLGQEIRGAGLNGLDHVGGAAVSESTITGWLRPEFRISPQ